MAETFGDRPMSPTNNAYNRVGDEFDGGSFNMKSTSFNEPRQ